VFPVGVLISAMHLSADGPGYLCSVVISAAAMPCCFVMPCFVVITSDNASLFRLIIGKNKINSNLYFI